MLFVGVTLKPPMKDTVATPEGLAIVLCARLFGLGLPYGYVEGINVAADLTEAQRCFSLSR